MTGDDHAVGGTIGRWRNYLKQPDCGGFPISATSYYIQAYACETNCLRRSWPGIRGGLARGHCAAGRFWEFSDPPRDWDSFEELDAIYRHQLEIFDREYPSLPSPITNRTHGVVWTDYASQPVVEFNHGIRMDCTYYYRPPTWVNDRPGMFTGSGLPMRFANSDGKMIDVY